MFDNAVCPYVWQELYIIRYILTSISDENCSADLSFIPP
jgi:hypothetical protein